MNLIDKITLLVLLAGAIRPCQNLGIDGIVNTDRFPGKRH